MFSAIKAEMEPLNDNIDITTRSFIKKVCSILLLQLLLVGGIVGGIMGNDYLTDFKLTMFDRTLPGCIISFLLPILMIILMFLLGCIARQSRRISPLTYFLLSIFTIFHGIMLGSICAFSKHHRQIDKKLIDIGIFIGIGTSAAITLGITLLLATQIKWNYRKCLKTFLEIFLYGLMTLLIVLILLLNFMLNQILNNVNNG